MNGHSSALARPSGIRTAIGASRQDPESNEQQVLDEIRAAMKKVSFKLTMTKKINELTLHEINFAMHCLLSYGDSARRFSFGPHHTDHGAGAPPSGYQFTVSAEASLRTAPFHRRTLGNGVLAFPLDAGLACMRTESGATLDEYHLRSSRVRAAIDLAITNERLGGDERNYAGIFSSRRRDGARVVRQYWVVVQANDQAASERYFDTLLDAERAGKTWKQAFTENDALSTLVSAQTVHRARIACALIRACELGPVCAERDFDANVVAMIESEQFVDNVHDVVEQGLPGEMTYLNGMASNRAVTSSGLVVREAGRLGVTLISGPLEATRVKTDVGFPCWTGHKRSPFVTQRADETNEATESETTLSDRTFFWDGCETDERYRHNLTLSIEQAHVRHDKRWRVVESWLGHARDADELTLEPVVVKLHSTEPPRGACNGQCSSAAAEDDEFSCEL